CRETRPKSAEDEFQAWRKKIADLSPEDLLLSSSSLKPKLSLSPKLRPQLGNIRFSPDGKLILAQDDAGINVIKREPLSFIFQIPALGARAAVFGKDSNQVIFLSGGSRLEVWNLESRSREKLWQPDESLRCTGLVPSPDGKTAACTAARDVRLLDIDTGT